MRDIPNSKEIVRFFHCGRCMPNKPANVSPREWAQLEVGWTVLGLQVWCRRCECNIVHIDFEGEKHPANVTPRADA